MTIFGFEAILLEKNKLGGSMWSDLDDYGEIQKFKNGRWPLESFASRAFFLLAAELNFLSKYEKWFNNI